MTRLLSNVLYGTAGIRTVKYRTGTVPLHTTHNYAIMVRYSAVLTTISEHIAM